jgi:hypothetical protein
MLEIQHLGTIPAVQRKLFLMKCCLFIHANSSAKTYSWKNSQVSNPISTLGGGNKRKARVKDCFVQT